MEHLNTLDCTMKTPNYLISLVHGISLLVTATEDSTLCLKKRQ